MMAIDHANLAQLDLNLLVAFDALIAERSVTRAAARTGVGQSAMSHSLGRLRAMFADELLTRAPDGMRPTPRALALIEPVRAALGQIQMLTTARQDFSAASSDRVFRIGLPDSMEVLLMPSLLAYLRAEAPGIRLRLHSTAGQNELLDDLDTDRLDMAIGLGRFPGGGAHHKQRALMTGSYLCMFNAQLIGISPPISLADYVRLPHVLTSLRSGEHGVVDDALASIGLRRSVALTTPRFLAVPFLVRGAPVVTTMHAQLARLFATALGLSLSPPPVALPEISISLLWHASYDDDPGHTWLRQNLSRLATEVGRTAHDMATASDQG